MKTHKGTIYDILFISVMLVVIAIGVIIVAYTMGQVRTGLETGGMNATQLGPLDNSLDAIGNWNALLIFVYMGVGLGAIISAFAVKTHPIFFVAFFIMQVLTIGLTPQLQDIYTAVSSNPTLNTTATQFDAFATTIDFLPYLTLVLSSLVALAMFAIPTG